jgi:hypothetical protein
MQVHIHVKFERRLFISALRNRPFFTKKKKVLNHPFGKSFVFLFSAKLYGQPAFKFDKDYDTHSPIFAPAFSFFPYNLCMFLSLSL